MRKRARLAWSLLVAFGLLAPRAAPAVVVLDSTWREEGGARGREAAGFGAHIRLAREPQFRSLVAVSYDDGATWGSGSGTWIGNDDAHGYVLTSAHVLEDTAANTVVVRTDGGTILRGTRAWIHPGYKPEGDYTGVDVAILRLARPVTDAGPPPVLYSGSAEKGRTITFMGFGTRGIGSVGENERYNRGSEKAAAQGLVEEAVPLRRMSAKVEDPGNYLTVFLPREDGGIENPLGGPRRPVSRLAGLLGSGDSGGSAWMPLGGGWVVVGINTSGDGEAQYGDNSWFVRVSGVRPWIASVFSGARFAADGDAVAALSPVQMPTAAPVALASAATPGDAAGCRVRERLFVFSDEAWYPAVVRGAGGAPGACRVRFDGYGADEDEVVGASRMLPWNADGPGAPLTACQPGAAVVAETDGVWYPATVLRGGTKSCTVHYDDEEEEDESLPFRRLRTLR
ncbi:MAG TPA: trypsin-like serine protease [Azospirillum sp.]|nr:trypsin-like serine protease [Azospirillum sp.]